MLEKSIREIVHRRLTNRLPNTRPDVMSEALETRATCENCGHELSGRYCDACGQDSTLGLSTMGEWLRVGLDHALGLDFRLARTLRLLLTKPGRLTELYLEGHRQPYTHPFRLYLIVSAVALAAMSAIGVLDLSSLSASIDPTVLTSLKGRFGIDLVDPEVRRIYDARINLLFPVFNLFTPIGLALALKLLHRRELLQKHAVFGLHVASAQVAFSTFSLGMLYLPQMLMAVASLLVMLVLAGYVFFAYRALYPAKWLGTLLRFVLLCGSYLVLVQIITISTLLAVLLTV